MSHRLLRSVLIFGSPEFVSRFGIEHPDSKIFAVCPRVSDLSLSVDRKLDWRVAKYGSSDVLKDCVGASLTSFPRLSKNQIEKAAHIEQIYLKMADRLGEFESYQWRKDLYLDHLEFWWGLIEISNFSFFLFENVPHEGFDFIAYGLARLHGCPTCGFFQLPIRPRESYFLQLWTDISDLGGVYRFNKERSLFDDSWQSKFQHYLALTDRAPESIEPFTRASATNSLAKLNGLLSKVIKIVETDNAFHRKGVSVNVRRVLRFLDLYDPYIPNLAFLAKDYKRFAVAPDLGAKYIYFALHYQPELSTSPLGGVFVDQLNIIKILSTVAVNLDLQVYVKEHPRSGKALGARSRVFYRDVNNLPNVRLIQKNWCSYKLIDNAVAVAAVTGSTGFEASLRNRKVLMFGSRFYSEASNVYLVDSTASVLRALQVESGSVSRECKLDRSDFFGFLSLSVCEGFIDRKDSAIATVTREKSVSNQCHLLSFYIKNGIFD